MTTITLINPDDFLGQPRVWTPERSRQAWEQCYVLLEQVLANAKGRATLYIVCGVQGAGKSWWIRGNLSALQTPAVVFDAALPAARHRERALGLARQYGCTARAIWLNTPLELALVRNRQRSADQQVPEEAICSVYELFEAPSVAEGFASVGVVAPAAPD